MLGAHLGPLLFQLPPNLKCDLPRLDAFLTRLPPDLRAAFEFRHDSWLTDEVCALLEAHKAAPLHRGFRRQDDAVARDRAARLFPPARRRLHAGRSRTWAGRVAERANDWDDAFVYFKHEGEGKGPEFAAAFREILTKNYKLEP